MCWRGVGVCVATLQRLFTPLTNTCVSVPIVAMPFIATHTICVGIGPTNGYVGMYQYM